MNLTYFFKISKYALQTTLMLREWKFYIEFFFGNGQLTCTVTRVFTRMLSPRTLSLSLSWFFRMLNCLNTISGFSSFTEYTDGQRYRAKSSEQLAAFWWYILTFTCCVLAAPVAREERCRNHFFFPALEIFQCEQWTPFLYDAYVSCSDLRGARNCFAGIFRE